jgi:hypothetical protein
MAGAERPLALRTIRWDSSQVTLFFLAGLAVLAVVLVVTSDKPRRWLERRYWRRQRRRDH